MTDYPLILNQIHKSFDDGDKKLTILNNLSFEVKKGEIIAVIGPSGSGKSTFLSIAGALLTADKGEVIIGGQNVSSYNAKKTADVRLNHIGYIFQTSNLVPYLTVEDQLSLILKVAGKWGKHHTTYINELISAVELSHRKKHHPHQLSGGEKQRAAIARAFVNNPDLILADEPTASLDSKRSWDVMKLISTIVKEQNKSAVIVTHDEQILSLCDRIFMMNDGMLVEKNSIG